MDDGVRLFGREAVLRVESLELSGLRISFNVKKSEKKEPNTAEVKVYNLEASTRKALGNRKTARVQLLAGYAGSIAQIFAGDLRVAESMREGANWLTRFESGDGESSSRASRVNKSFAKLTFRQMLNELASAIGVGAGNAPKLAEQGRFQGALQSLAKGSTINGRASEILDVIARSSGYEWSIQDGQLQFVQVGRTLQTEAVSLSPDTGLLGSPELGEKGFITARSLLQPSIIPGRKVQVKSRQVDGFFKVTKLEHSGDTRGDDWSTTFEGVPI